MPTRYRIPARRFSLRGTIGACGCLALLAAALCLPLPLRAADGDASGPDRGESYYHFALGHLYHQFAQQFGRREYIDRAAKEYQSALDGDPESAVIRMEMINLFAATNRLARAVALADEIIARDPQNAEVRRLLGEIYRSYYSKQRQDPNREEPNLEFLRKAIEQFKLLVELEPDNATHHLELGQMQALAGDPELGQQTLRRAIELEPGNSDARVSLAYILLETGKINDAITELEQVVSDGPSNRQHINALAGAYEQAGRAEDAARLYERLLQEGGNTLQARQRLAENLFRSGAFRKALEQYQVLAELDSGEAEYFLRIAALQGELKDYDSAWNALEKAREIDPDSLQVQFAAINLLEAQGRQEQAIAELTKLLDATRRDEYPRSEHRRRLMLLERLGVLQRQQGHSQSAVKTFREITALQPDLKPQILAQIVQTWLQGREFARAEQEARRATDEFKDDPALANLLAAILADRGKTKEAIKVVQRMGATGQAEIDTALAMARVYEKGRQFDKAEEQIDRASKLVDSEEARIAVLFAYGSMYERAKRYEQAEAKFRELLDIAPDNSTALNYLGYMFADRGMHLDEAHDLIQRALDLEPNNGAYLDSLGWVYFRQNKLDLAAKFLERSLEQYKDDPVVHTHLGDVYYKQGRIADAKRHWNRGLEEWNRSAPADRDASEVESLRRKLAELEVSVATGGEQDGNDKTGVKR